MIEQQRHTCSWSNLPIFGSLEKSLFALDEVDLAATPQVVKRALARTNIEGGKVTKIVIEPGLANRARDSGEDVPAICSA